MKLVSATVTGLFGVYDHRIELDPEGVTFVHSTNGMGKSIFLKLIYGILRGYTVEVKAVPFTRLDLGFDDGSTLIVENGEELLVQMQKNELEERLGRYDLETILPAVYVSPERLTVKRKDGRLMYAIDVYADELEDRFLSAKEETAIDVAAASPGEEMSDADIESRLADLKPKTDFMYSAGLRMNLPVGLRMTPSRYDIHKSHDSYLRLTRAVEEYVADCYDLAESIVVFQDVVNSFFINKRLSISNGKMQITLNNGSHIPLEVLSSGEKHIIIMFYRLLFQTPHGALAIIDEPEISIHVSWQQRLGRVLMDVCRLRDLQIVAATHSPQVIHDMWDRSNELRA